jgi:CubicO group peptidase (beta-lactamase class C family)
VTVAILIAIAFSAQWAPPQAAAEQGATDRVPAALDQLDRVVAETMGRTHVPGIAVAVVHRDQVVYLKGFGVRTAGGSEPIDPDTAFQLASVSKPIASTLVAALVGDGG